MKEKKMKKQEDIINTEVNTINNVLTYEANEQYPLPQFPDDYTAIERAIAEMMTESTGVHILDSGGEDNRSWQRNRKIKDFRTLPILTVDLHDDGTPIFELDIFHYLTSMLEINDETNKLNADFNNFISDHDCSWLSCIDEYGDKLMEKQWHVFPIFNTYNYENILSQVLQGMTFYKDYHEDDPFIILQIHNGADVRGGYTKPRIFKIKDVEEFTMAQNNVYANCKCGTVYSDDGGYHWYKNDGDLNVINYKLPTEWKLYKVDNTNILKCEKCNTKINFYGEQL
ncbi:MAG: hypothetical protein QXZ12_06880 [Thermoplasmata archaeon]